MVGPHTIRRILNYLPKFLGFVYRTFPLTWMVLILTMLGVILEYATLSVMLPLAGSGINTRSFSIAVIVFWGRAASLFGFSNSPQTWIWMFLVLLALRTTVDYAQTTLNGFVAKQVHSFFAVKIFRRVVIDEPLSEIYRKSIGHYVSLAGNETFQAGMVVFYTGQMLASGLSAIAGFIILYVFSREAFWLTILFVGLCAAILSLVMRSTLRLSSQSMALSRLTNTTFIEALNGLRSVRSMSVENFVVGNYRDQILRYVKLLFRIESINQGSKVFPALFLALLGVAWIWPGGSASESVSPVYFFAVTTMLIRVLASLGGVVTAGGKMVADIHAAHDVGELIDYPKKYLKVLGISPLKDRISHITMQDLACAYSDNRLVLSNVTGEFQVGRSYAIVGESGSGKSTLADVLLGLLPASAGDIYVNGIPYPCVSIESLRRRIVLVEQETRIFSGSLRENVALGMKTSDDQVSAALDSAGLADFVSGLPNGLGEDLDYQGANLSGGQRQRIGIARALLRHPDVLILDECTNALDPRMRVQVVNALRAQFREKILIFITHDSEVVRAVDEVWRIQDGTLLR